MTNVRTKTYDIYGEISIMKWRRMVVSELEEGGVNSAKPLGLDYLLGQATLAYTYIITALNLKEWYVTRKEKCEHLTVI